MATISKAPVRRSRRSPASRWWAYRWGIPSDCLWGWRSWVRPGANQSWSRSPIRLSRRPTRESCPPSVRARH